MNPIVMTMLLSLPNTSWQEKVSIRFEENVIYMEGESFSDSLVYTVKDYNVYNDIRFYNSTNYFRIVRNEMGIVIFTGEIKGESIVMSGTKLIKE